MKYLSISPQLFTKNRLKFTQQMKSNSIAVFNSNDVFSTGADSTLPFEQHRNIFYLSGVDQEESILLLFPDATEASQREILFVKETNDLSQFGKVLSFLKRKRLPPQASKRSIG